MLVVAWKEVAEMTHSMKDTNDAIGLMQLHIVYSPKSIAELLCIRLKPRLISIVVVAGRPRA